MGIYNRDEIDYGSMIDNMIKNRMETDRIRSDNIRKQGDIWSNFSKDTGNMIARGMDYVQYANEQKELENKLKDLEARRDTIRNAYTQSQDYKSSEYMKGYKNYDNAKDKWLQAHPGMSEEDYERFVEFQNALYGGI